MGYEMGELDIGGKGGRTKNMQASRATFLFSRFFLSFRFPFSPLHTTQTSKAVLSTVMFIFRRCQSILHRRRLNSPRYWIYSRNHWWLEESSNLAMRGFCREPFRINIESFQALSLILSLFMTRFWAAVYRWRIMWRADCCAWVMYLLIVAVVYQTPSS